MQELDTINQWLGGHQVTLKGFQQLVKNTTSDYGSLSVVEMGCGGGDNLRFLKNYTSNQWNLQLTGIDINPKCIAYAEGNPLNAGIRFIHSDYSAVQFRQKPDIIFSSLFCHHFTNSELVSMLRWMLQNARLGFFINDLHRHPVAYYSIKLLTAALSKSRLVKHDAPLSVLRGFKRNEWRDLLLQAGITQAQCSWQWAFRWLVSCNK